MDQIKVETFTITDVMEPHVMKTEATEGKIRETTDIKASIQFEETTGTSSVSVLCAVCCTFHPPDAHREKLPPEMRVTENGDVSKEKILKTNEFCEETFLTGNKLENHRKTHDYAVRFVPLKPKYEPCEGTTLTTAQESNTYYECVCTVTMDSNPSAHASVNYA